MKIHTPIGEIGPAPVALAAAPPVLAGLRIGVLDNTKPNAGLLLTRIARQLAARTGAEVTLIETKNAAVAAPDEVIAHLKEEVDLVLTGSAD